MKVSRRPPPAPYIPFISLADIAWQIIIFFLVAATFVRGDSLKLAIPSSTTDPATKEINNVTVQASETTLAVNGQAVAIADLQSKITSVLAGKKDEKDRIVIVSASEDLTFQRDADILFAIQKAGGIVVIADEGKKEQGQP
jgi:biopolymer transport protein ExbD